MILTVDDLYVSLKDARSMGLGKKKILVSDDNEGNGYHPLTYPIMCVRSNEDAPDFFNVAMIDKPFGVTDENVDEYVLLG